MLVLRLGWRVSGVFLFIPPLRWFGREGVGSMLVDHSERVFSPAGILLLVRAAKLARLLFFMEPSIPVRFLFLPIRSWSAFSPMVGAWKSRRRPCGWGGESRPGRRRGCTGLVQVHPNTLKTSGVTQHQDECPSFISCKINDGHSS